MARRRGRTATAGAGSPSFRGAQDAQEPVMESRPPFPSSRSSFRGPVEAAVSEATGTIGPLAAPARRDGFNRKLAGVAGLAGVALAVVVTPSSAGAGVLAARVAGVAL